MLDFLRIHVLWAAQSVAGKLTAELISRHFDGIGMERDGVAFRIPVRFRSDPWDNKSIRPRGIDLQRARHNAVVLLYDDYMNADRADWDGYVKQVRSDMDNRGGADVYIPFSSPTGEIPLRSDMDRRTQYARRDHWNKLPSDPARDSRLLLHLVLKLRQHVRSVIGSPMKTEPLFVSHAKADGDVTARAIVDYVNDTTNDVPLETFYDAMELSPGEDFEARFEAEISHGTLLAIVSDVYDTRPWCVYELTTAKSHHRPIVLADVGKVRTSRTYPYGANLPRVRLTPTLDSSTWVEPLLVETLSEGLRCDVFEAHADRVLAVANIHQAVVLPRPPELLDIVDLCGQTRTIVYPDPPLGRIESEILHRAIRYLAPDSTVLSLGQVK
ncbi:toll/interleukin-1 receptor domain-containing protein [Mesorhizobium sp.]|uniref:toll/interleukin-1 receptor domain-containing protein n=1 Tax=Mesorhizobium sp. TaxID=1871066 RepID=UPI000FE977CD|nr:toll/interleukin-1 receptor domain-containing protein [Mesorhizobium sp.]RWE79576.1 MAG: TIR domain-containing protein [Mesorhizobium sp.]